MRTCCAFVAHDETQRIILFGGAYRRVKHQAFVCKRTLLTCNAS